MANEFTEIINRINDAVRDETQMRAALSTVLAFHKPRIFQEGQDRNGAKIGTYGTNPISISKTKQARQTGKTYFKGGYAEYKNDIGKNPGYVNLRNTDQMMSDYGLQGSGQQFGFGFQNNENYNKSQWMQEKYDKDIFDLSDRELEVLTNIRIQQLNKSIGQ